MKRKNFLKIFSLLFVLCLCSTFFVACNNKEPIFYTVTFVYDNGTENSTIEVEEGKLLQKPTDPSKVGYIFDGWYIDDFKWGFNFVHVMDDVTLTAHWVPKELQVTFVYDNGVTENQVVDVLGGEKATCPIAPVKAEYDFAGWFNGETEWNLSEDVVLMNTTLTAHWTPSPLPYYTITFELDDGRTYETIRAQKGSTISCPTPAPTKEFFDVEGWYKDDLKWDFDDDVVSEEMTLTVHWKHHDFNITYVTYNAAHNNPTTFNRGQESKNLLPAVKEGYSFEGWYKDTKYIEEVTELTPDITEDLTLYACLARRFTQDNINYCEYGINLIANGPVEGFEGNEITLIDGCTEIGERAFENLTRCTICAPSTLRKIGYYAFKGAINVNLIGGENVTEIGIGAFKDSLYISYSSDKDSRDFIWPSGTTTMYENTFEQAELRTLVLPSTLNEIQGEFNPEMVVLMYNNTSINLDGKARTIVHADEILEDDIIYKIGKDTKIAVGYYIGKSELIFAEDCTGIAEQSFQSNSLISTVYITKNIKFIGVNAFANCVNLKTLYNFSDLVITKDSVEYEFAHNLDNIYKAEFEIISGVKYLRYDEEMIAVGLEDKSVKDVVINANCTSIGHTAFAETQIESVEFLGNKVKTISYRAFRNCKQLKSVTLKEGLETIEADAFYECIALESIKLPSSVKILKQQAFIDCSNLKTAILNEGLETIEQCTFQGSGLTSIVIPNSVTRLANMVFRYCPLESVTLGTGIKTLEAEIFESCTKLTRIVIPENIEEIKYGAFFGSGLTSIAIPNTVTVIGEKVFKNCKNLESVTFGDYPSIEVIEIETFYGTAITEITIPQSITEIKDGAFFDCENLKTVENYSTLELTKGDEGNGYVAFYADEVNNYNL